MKSTSMPPSSSASWASPSSDAASWCSRLAEPIDIFVFGESVGKTRVHSFFTNSGDLWLCTGVGLDNQHALQMAPSRELNT